MGDEYTLSFRVDAKEDVENAFKALPSFDRVYELHGRRVLSFELRPTLAKYRARRHQ